MHLHISIHQHPMKNSLHIVFLLFSLFSLPYHYHHHVFRYLDFSSRNKKGKNKCDYHHHTSFLPFFLSVGRPCYFFCSFEVLQGQKRNKRTNKKTMYDMYECYILICMYHVSIDAPNIHNSI